MKISFIGSGNVAWHLAQAFEKSNHNVAEIYSRNKVNARALCKKLYNATATDSLNFSGSKAEIFIIAVSDDAIEQIVKEIIIPSHVIVVHTSGSKSLDILSPLTHTQTGIFYPLQTFTKAKPINLRTVPICIETTDIATEKTLEKLAFTICENVCFYNSDDRRKLHLAAVFACNFTNHLLTISKKLLEKEGLEFTVLKPLIKETIEKSLTIGPEKSQTGPASRNDRQTIQNQLKLLENYPLWQTIYENMTQSIIKSEYSK